MLKTKKSVNHLSWLGIIDTLLPKLRQLSENTEKDFLKIGKEMQIAYGHAMELSVTAQELIEVANGEQTIDLTNQLDQTMVNMSNSLEYAQNHTVKNLEQIFNVSNVLKEVRRPVDDFLRIAKRLYIIEVLIRIESTYLDTMESDFINLASDIRKLSSQIKYKTSETKTNIDSILYSVEQNSSFYEKMIANGDKKRKYAVSSVENSLITLKNIHQKFNKIGMDIEYISKENAESISMIVQFLQIHDSYRQQVEHVVTSLEVIVDEYNNESNIYQNDNGEFKEYFIRKIGDICEIQHAQLNYASNSLYDSVESIIKELKNLQISQKKITKISSDSTKNEKESSFIDDISNHITTVITLVDEYSVTSTKLDEIISHVLDVTEDITDFINDVESFGSEIIQIALNARIKAVATGSDGAAMSSLSEEVGLLSKDAVYRTGVISEVLGSIKNIENSFSEDTEYGQNSIEIKFINIQEQFKYILASLDKINEKLQILHRKMYKQGENLILEIDNLSKSIDIHRIIKKSVDEILEKLKIIFTESRKCYPANDLFKKELLDLSSKYTMDSERKVHMQIAQKHGVMHKIDDIKAKEKNDTESEFGDNVDLF